MSLKYSLLIALSINFLANCEKSNLEELCDKKAKEAKDYLDRKEKQFQKLAKEFEQCCNKCYKEFQKGNLTCKCGNVKEDDESYWVKSTDLLVTFFGYPVSKRQPYQEITYDENDIKDAALSKDPTIYSKKIQDKLKQRLNRLKNRKKLIETYCKLFNECVAEFGNCEFCKEILEQAQLPIETGYLWNSHHGVPSDSEINDALKRDKEKL